MSKPRIGIVQLSTPQIDVFAKYSMANLMEYCDVYGYNYMVQRIKSVPDMHINWSKIDLIRKAFSTWPEHNYYILMDADIIVYNLKRSVESIINQHLSKDTHILFSGDTPFTLFKKPKPNAGFVVVRNSTIGKQIINRWIEASTTDGARYNDTHPRNQLVYWNLSLIHI